MRSVLLAAACAMCLAFTAHGAEAPDQQSLQKTASDTQMAPPLPPVAPAGNTCIDGSAALSHAAYATDEDADCCTASSYCSQYLSTQMLVPAPTIGHT